MAEFTHAFICTSTSQHLDQLKKILLSNVKKIYLEKPVSDTWDGIEEILGLITSDKKIAVGYDLRFDPGLTLVKDLLDSGRFGKVLSATSFVGQYLPDWRPHEDYRKGSSALKSKGGGVLLDLVHEFDYLYWILGKAKFIAGLYQNNPGLKIETEDLADVLVQFESGHSATIHLDYHQRILERFCLLTCTRGSIRWDLAKKEVVWVDEFGEKETIDFSEHERNERFISILSEFMEGEQFPKIANFHDGLESLKMVLAVKKSSETHTFVML